VKLLLGDRGQDAALHPDHRADEGVDHDQQGELREVLAQPSAAARHDATASGPRLKRTGSRRISAGLGGTSATAAMNASRASASSGLKRRSKARVVEGLPLMPAPQAEPAKCAG
jgi:hypothetical protein